jgi:hypothetical protein
MITCVQVYDLICVSERAMFLICLLVVVQGLHPINNQSTINQLIQHYKETLSIVDSDWCGKTITSQTVHMILYCDWCKEST